MRLIVARKMKEAPREAEVLQLRKARLLLEEEEEEEVTMRRCYTMRFLRRLMKHQEKLEAVGGTEQGLEKANTAKMEAEEGNWMRSSCSAKFKNPIVMDVNGLNMMMNGDGTSSSVAVWKPTMSIGQILSRKLLLADDAMLMDGRISLGQVLGKTNIGDQNMVLLLRF